MKRYRINVNTDNLHSVNIHLHKLQLLQYPQKYYKVEISFEHGVK